MSKRAAAAAETRRRIVEATSELHGEQGIAVTSWDDIAARAGVGVGTVYRHFPSLDELIPVCGQVVAELVALPSPEAAAAAFAGVRGREERLARLASEVFAIYERGAPPLRSARREPEVADAIAAAYDGWREGIEPLVAAAEADGSIDGLDPEAVLFLYRTLYLGLLLHRGTGLDGPDADAWRALIERVVAGLGAPADDDN